MGAVSSFFSLCNCRLSAEKLLPRLPSLALAPDESCGSWKGSLPEEAPRTASTGSRQPRSTAQTTLRAMVAGRGRFANFTPSLVMTPSGVRVPRTFSSCTAFLTATASGGCGAWESHDAISSAPPAGFPMPSMPRRCASRCAVWRQTSSKGDRNNSGARNSSIFSCLARENRWKHTPALVRPARPARCAADALEMKVVAKVPTFKYGS
mmetsp:Transcript_25533/g.73347  ORF Transcript_25533/g.73347 Transcript_25533/m.73347 type:complete len:208 (+) Transcript_25533:799-1422(+)